MENFCQEKWGCTPHFEAMIPLLSVPLLDDRDFLFHPTAQTNLTLFTHIIHLKTTKILVKNTSDQPLRILRRQRLGHVIDIHYNNCFLADARSDFNSVTVSPKVAPFFKHKPSCIQTSTNPFMKTRLDNEVGIYGDKYAVTLVKRLLLSIFPFGNLKALSRYHLNAG